VPISRTLRFIMVTLLLCAGNTFAAKGVNVVYPGWFKDSFYDLQGDLQEAGDAGKQGIMVFFSTKTCSYCNAIIETTFQQHDIVKRLRASYDVIGLEVFSDTEVVDTRGESHWAKDFAVSEKAQFTPTMIFYGADGEKQLRLIGYQSPEKFRGVLDYLEGGHYKNLKLGDYLGLKQATPIAVTQQQTTLNLDRRSVSRKPLLVVFESADCSKCQQLRTMLKAPVMQPYTQQLDIAQVSSADTSVRITTPDGNNQNGKEWSDQLGLIHSPAMVFFNEHGKEVLRVDTDILIDSHGRDVSANNEAILDNIRARLQFVLDKGYVTLPQFQRWRAQQSKTTK
jgi:thioredoxin-related protein